MFDEGKLNELLFASLGGPYKAKRTSILYRPLVSLIILLGDVRLSRDGNTT